MHTSDAREEPIPPPDVPSTLAPWVEGRRWSRNLVGEAGAAVYRLSPSDASATSGKGAVSGDLYLKHGTGRVAADVLDEALRLQWLGGQVRVPRVRQLIACTASQSEVVTGPHGAETWLLMDALPGRTAYELLVLFADVPEAQADVVDALVVFMRRLHDIPVERCPFISDHRRRLADARQRLEGGLVDEDDFGDAHDGWTASQVWDAMTALLPLEMDAVVTHGDFSLDNVLLTDRSGDDGFEVVGCLDVGRVGVADRYQDLAILHDCLGEFGEALQARVFTQYGIDTVDDARLRFHRALDEFF